MSIVYANLNHPQRVALAAEVHSRPFLHLKAPESLTHLAVYVRDKAADASRHAVFQHALLTDLCVHFGVTAPGVDAKHFFHDFGRFRLKWECHTEFATYTFVEPGEPGMDCRASFERMPLQHVPQQWLAGLNGKIIVAAHVLLCKGEDDDAAFAEGIRDLFPGKSLVGSSAGGNAEVWTDFLIQPDGFSRFVV